MTFNWNPTKNDLSQMSNKIIERIDIIYNSINDKPNIIPFLRQENIVFSNVYSYFSFVHDISDKSEIKSQCSKIINIISLKKKELFSNKKIFEKINNVIQNSKELSNEDLRFLKYLFKEFKQNGIYLEKNQKVELLGINNKIDKYQSNFLHNLDNEPNLTLKKENTIGLDESFLNEHKVNNEYKMKLNEHTYNYLIENLEFSDVRKLLQTTFFEHYKNNYVNLEKIITNRYKLAKMFGFTNYIDYINNDQTLNNREKILSFLFNLNKTITPQYEKDLVEICDYFNIQKVDNKYLLNNWDLPYLIHNYKNKKFRIDNSITNYFPVESTLEKIILLFETTFKLKISKITIPIWHPSVNVYQISKDNVIIGEIYMDIFDRNGKSVGSATITIKEPLEICNQDVCNTQNSVTAITANFPVNERNNCFNIQEISIIFHELTHALHMMLGKCKYTFLCSNNIEYSFIETFPQLLELWLLNKDVVKHLSNHYKTKQQLNDKDLEHLIESNKSLRSINVKYQIFLSLLDIMIYNEKIALSLIEVENKKEEIIIDTPIFKKSYKKSINIIENIFDDLYISCYNFVFHTKSVKIFPNPKNNPYLIFNHTVHGYSGQYYGYVWSDHIANELFVLIQNKKHYIDKLIDSITSGNNYSPTQILQKYFNKYITN